MRDNEDANELADCIEDVADSYEFLLSTFRCGLLTNEQVRALEELAVQIDAGARKQTRVSTDAQGIFEKWYTEGEAK